MIVPFHCSSGRGITLISINLILSFSAMSQSGPGRTGPSPIHSSRIYRTPAETSWSTVHRDRKLPEYTCEKSSSDDPQATRQNNTPRCCSSYLTTSCTKPPVVENEKFRTSLLRPSRNLHQRAFRKIKENRCPVVVQDRSAVPGHASILLPTGSDTAYRKFGSYSLSLGHLGVAVIYDIHWYPAISY